MGRDIQVRCACGALSASAANVAPETINHVICYCADCQNFARTLGQEDRILDPDGGTRIVQLEPTRVTIESGGEHLACLRFTPKGLHRWYAACCNTPFANTSGTPKFPFGGLMAANMEATESDLGPIIAQVFTKHAASPKRAYGLPRTMWRAMRTVASARLTGRWRETPFFDAETGEPVSKPRILSEDTEAQ